jgi:fucose permease
VLWLGALSFYVLGIVLVVLGVLQAEMTRDLGLDLSEFGLLGSLLSLGFGAGLSLVGPLVDRLPRRWLFAGACGVAGLALVGMHGGMAVDSVALHLLLLGVGGGCCVTLMNAAVIGHYRERAAPVLAFMHAASTAGASSGPWLIGWGHAAFGGGWARTFHALCAAYLALAVIVAVRGLPGPPAAAATQGDGHAAATSTKLLSGKLIALALVVFAYVGVENGLTLFAVPWAVSQRLSEAAGRSGISAFWLGLMAGRLTLALRRPAPATGTLVACGALGAVAVCIAAVASWSPVVALAAAGLALGPVYPVSIALTGMHFPRASGAALGLVAGAGALGGFVLPWIGGAVGDALEAKASIALFGACACLIALGAFALGAPRVRAS